MHFLLVAIALLAVSCLEENPPISELDDTAREPEELWICHNPDNLQQHNKVCTDECYEDGNYHKYCWLFEKEECYTDGHKIEIVNEICKEVLP